MKKIGIIAGGVLLLIIVGIFVLQENTKQPEKQMKVGFVMNGSKDDASWGQSHYEGMEKAAQNLKLNVIYRENVPEDEACIPVMEELIEQGCEVIICNSYDFGKYELEVAEEHPYIYFYHATGVEEAKNMSTYFGRIYQMRYLCGIVAGLQTKTNEIGYVAAYPISEVNRGINAFALGVRSVNPDAKVYVEWSNSWIDDDSSREAANRLISGHNIDVMTVHSDSLAAYDVADENGIWIIGYNIDNSEKYPDTFLTAAVWSWDKFYEPRLKECQLGKFQSMHYWEDIQTGVVSLAPFTANVKPEIGNFVHVRMEALKNGTFDVFWGPIKDNQGNLRITEGESMSDDVMLNEFDWYVEGVVADDKE